MENQNLKIGDIVELKSEKTKVHYMTVVAIEDNDVECVYYSTPEHEYKRASFPSQALNFIADK